MTRFFIVSWMAFYTFNPVLIAISYPHICVTNLSTFRYFIFKNCFQTCLYKKRNNIHQKQMPKTYNLLVNPKFGLSHLNNTPDSSVYDEMVNSYSVTTELSCKTFVSQEA